MHRRENGQPVRARAARRRARAPAAGGRGRATSSARRAASTGASCASARASTARCSSPPRERARAAARRALRARAARARASRGLAVVAALVAEVADVRRAAEQDVLARRVSSGGSLGRLRHERDPPRELAPRQRPRTSSPSSAIEPVVRDEPGERAQQRASSRRRSGRSAPPTRRARPRARRRRTTSRARRASRRDVARARSRAASSRVRRTIAKNGAPKKAVTTPIGSSAGEMIVRASDVGEHEEAGADERARAARQRGSSSRRAAGSCAGR